MKLKQQQGLVFMLDVGISMSSKPKNSPTTYLKSCSDIIRMIVKKKLLQSSKDEIALILYGSLITDNVLWKDIENSGDNYKHIQVVRQLSSVDCNLLGSLQKEIEATNLQGDILDALIVSGNHFHENLNKNKAFTDKRIMVFTDFSSRIDEDRYLDVFIHGCSKHSIRVDVITPFSNQDIQTLSEEQKYVYEILTKVYEQTNGKLYSFGEGILNFY